MADPLAIYQVMKEWTNDDGWGIASPSLVITFRDEHKARQYIFDQTKQQTALDYGFADVHLPSGNMDRWSIRKTEVAD